MTQNIQSFYRESTHWLNLSFALSIFACCIQVQPSSPHHCLSDIILLVVVMLCAASLMNVSLVRVKPYLQMLEQFANWTYDTKSCVRQGWCRLRWPCGGQIWSCTQADSCQGVQFVFLCPWLLKPFILTHWRFHHLSKTIYFSSWYPFHDLERPWDKFCWSSPLNQLLTFSQLEIHFSTGSPLWRPLGGCFEVDEDPFKIVGIHLRNYPYSDQSLFKQ